jgi:hypothetical protein
MSEISIVRGRNWRKLFDVLMKQPMLASNSQHGLESMLKEMSMRFMMVVIPKGYEVAAADAAPGAEAVARMMDYNKNLQKAGILLALDGLLPPSTAARISYADGKATVTDGPFTEAKEAIGGYWILQVRSREEAIEWARRAPMGNNEIIEVRQIYERGDFPADVQHAAEGFEDVPNAAAGQA